MVKSYRWQELRRGLVGSLPMSTDLQQLRALHTWLGRMVTAGDGADPSLAFGWDEVEDGAFYGLAERARSEAAIPSATDLLVPWQPMPGGPSSGSDPAFGSAGRRSGFEVPAMAESLEPVPDEVWDTYFASEPSVLGTPLAAADTGATDETGGKEAISVPAEALEAYDASWMVPALADAGSREEAVAVVYDFLHGIERRDLDVAFELVADDFHAMEGDQELDRQALRNRFAELLDHQRGATLRVSPIRIPQALPHPVGMLVPLEIVIDATTDDEARSWRFDRIAVLEMGCEGSWQITGLGTPGDVDGAPTRANA